jgi:hypothetical protein
VGRLLKANKYSLRTNRKWLARTHELERDQQFRYIARQRRRFQKHGNPAVSIDTKKKEQVGLFKNPGRTWRQTAIDVWDHDFPSLAVGRGIPFGIYDAQRQSGGDIERDACFRGQGPEHVVGPGWSVVLSELGALVCGGGLRWRQ